MRIVPAGGECICVLAGFDQIGCEGTEVPAGIGQLDAAADPVEQLYSELLFKLLDV